MAARVPFSTDCLAPEYRKPTIEEFYEKFRPYTLTSVIRSGVSPSDAEDVVHEIFIKFLYGGYYESYDYSKNVTFKNFYRHVMKLYLRGMSESYVRKRDREPLWSLTQIRSSNQIEGFDAEQVEFVESIREQAKKLTDAQAVVLMVGASLALDGEPWVTHSDIGKRVGLPPYKVRNLIREIADVYDRS